MLRSSIDLGTNTCLLLIAELNKDGKEILNVLSDKSSIVRLGKGVDQSRTLNPEAMKRTLECLRTYSSEVIKAGISTAETKCVATSQARDATNAAQFFAEIEKETGFRFKTISGEEEAMLTFLGGLLPGMSKAESIIIDIGGGSTEFIALNDRKSLDIGSVRFTERCLKSDPVSDQEFWACQEIIDQQLNAPELKSWRQGLPSAFSAVGVAGTATTVAAWHLGLKQFDANLIDQVVLSRGDLHRMVEELKWRRISERAKLPGIQAERADVILAGAMILWRAMEILNFPEIHVSTRGLRYGVIFQ